jgi:HAMP domain-containing protein
VRRSPLVQVETTAKAVAAGVYSVRVAAEDPRTEVGSFAASFNVMVNRFQNAYAAQ